MSKASAHAAIKHNFNNAIPAIDPSIVKDSSPITDAATADEIHRAIVRIDKIRATKEIQYKQCMDKVKADRQETLDALDEVRYLLDQRMQDYAKENLEGRHLDLPSGRVQFNRSQRVVIGDLGGEELTAVLTKYHKQYDGLVRWKPELNKQAVKDLLADPEVAKNLSWLSVEETESVSYSEDTTSAPPEPSREEGPAPAASNPTPGNDAAQDPVPTETPVAEEPAAENEGASPGPGEVASPPSGVDLSKAPRIFEVPSDDHYNADRLGAKAGAFEAMDVAKLLEGQSRVTIEHINTLPIDRVKGGMVAMMTKLGMGKTETRRWVAYHIGQTIEHVDPGKLDEATWRKLLALSVHAHTVMEKHKAGE